MAIDSSRTFKPISIAVLTISDTRTMADDTSGDILAERIKAAGHHLAARALERDDVAVIASKLNTWNDDPGIDDTVTHGRHRLTGRHVAPEIGRDASVERECEYGGKP